MKIKLGFVGAGRVAQLHAEAIAQDGLFEVVAVADPRPGAAAQLARRFDAAPYEDARRLLDNSAIDAVDIVVPHHLHAELASTALAAGKHVFMDKPLATNREDAEHLVGIAAGSKGKFMICHNLLFHPAVVRAKQCLADGVVGHVRVGDAWSFGWLDLAPWDFRRSREATGGGAWIDNAPHLIYTLEHLLGPMTALSAVPAVGCSRLEAEDTAMCNLTDPA